MVIRCHEVVLDEVVVIKVSVLLVIVFNRENKKIITQKFTSHSCVKQKEHQHKNIHLGTTNLMVKELLLVLTILELEWPHWPS